MLGTIPSAHLSSKNMHAAACCWLWLPGKSISINSVKSEIWLICLWWKSIFVGSVNLHFHPSLFVQNMAFDAGPGRRGHVKKRDHLYILFGAALKSGRSWPKCTQQGRLNWKSSSSDGLSYMVRWDGFGGWMTLQLTALNVGTPRPMFSTGKT